MLLVRGALALPSPFEGQGKGGRQHSAQRAHLEEPNGKPRRYWKERWRKKASSKDSVGVPSSKADTEMGAERKGGSEAQGTLTECSGGRGERK
jgi:hypothetical protein